jgi:WD40 repeat protein
MSNEQEFFCEDQETMIEEVIELEEEDLNAQYDEADLEEVDIQMEEKEDMEDMEDQISDDSSLVFLAHGEPVYSVASNPDNDDIVCTGGGDDVAFVWNTKTGEVIWELPKHDDSVVSVAFSFDGKYIASASMDGLINVCCMYDGSLKSSLYGSEIIWIKWHQISYLIIAGCSDGNIWVWNAENGENLSVLSHSNVSIVAGGFSLDGKRIVSASEDGSLCLFNSNTQIWKTSFPSSITSIDFNESLILCGYEDGCSKLFQLETGKLLGQLKSESEASVESVCMLGNSFAAIGSSDGVINVWDMNNFSIRLSCKHEDSIVSLRKLSPKNFNLFSSISVDLTVRVWDARNGECLKLYRGCRDTPLDIAVSKEGKQLIVCGDDRTALVFSI